jgi:beta-N-acetylhexosaminidase
MDCKPAFRRAAKNHQLSSTWPVALAAALWPVLLLWPAWHYKHPLLFAQRHLEMAFWLVLPCFVLWRWQRLTPVARGLLVALLLLVGWQEITWRLQREAVLAAGPAVRAVGQHFITGYTDYAEVAMLSRQGLIGGIHISRRNIQDRGFAEVRAEIATLQQERRQAGLPPLIVSADQEGGVVNHLSPLLEPMPALSALAAQADPRRAARSYGSRQGTALAALGINLNFAPVVDLKPETRPENDRLTNTSARAISGNPDKVTEIAAGYLDGLAAHDVRGTLKHFPGLRRVDRDTHRESARLGETPGQMANDWQPFRALAGHADSALMISHVVLETVDDRHAASHSPAVMTMLRQDWAYDGLIISDDLNMGAVYDLGIASVAAQTLSAGVDFVLVSYDPRQIYRAIHGAAQAFERGEITTEKLEKSRERIAWALTAIPGDMAGKRRENIARLNGVPGAQAGSAVVGAVH